MSRASHGRPGFWSRICQRSSVRTDRGRIRDDRHRPIREGRASPGHVSHRAAGRADGIRSDRCHVAFAVRIARWVPGFSDGSPGGGKHRSKKWHHVVSDIPSVRFSSVGGLDPLSVSRSLLQIRGRPVDPSKNPGRTVHQPFGSNGPRPTWVPRTGLRPRPIPTAEDLDSRIEISRVSSTPSAQVSHGGGSRGGEFHEGPFRETFPLHSLWSVNLGSLLSLFPTGSLLRTRFPSS